jgi:hypothetical protein
MNVSIVFLQEVAFSQHFAAKICASPFTFDANVADASSPSSEIYWLYTPLCYFGFCAPASRFSIPPHSNRVYQYAWLNVREGFCQGTGVVWGVVDTNVSLQYTSFGNPFSNPAAFTHCISFFFQIDAFRRPCLCDLQFLA